MEKRDFVLWFRDLGKEDIPLVGGKCANLGELLGRIAYGFDRFCRLHMPISFWKRPGQTKDRISPFSNGHFGYGSLSIQRRSGTHRKSPDPEGYGKGILLNIKTLQKYRQKNLPVAVRSSATAEDLPGAVCGPAGHLPECSTKPLDSIKNAEFSSLPGYVPEERILP
jgi:pyruvate,water dikinase